MPEKIWRGTCSPPVKVEGDPIGALNVALAGVDPEPVAMVVAALPALFTGPLERAVAETPVLTTPVLPDVVVAAVRMKRWFKSCGCIENVGITSSTT